MIAIVGGIAGSTGLVFMGARLLSQHLKSWSVGIIALLGCCALLWPAAAEAQSFPQLRTLVSATGGDRQARLARAASEIEEETVVANRDATGAPRVWGSTRRGEELFTEQGTIADPDGLPDGGFPAGYSFQWMRVASDKPETEVATTRNYRPVQADVGSKLKVKVSFTDGRGFVETRTSGETATITATTCSVTGVGVCNISEASDSGRTHLLNLGGPLATAFTTGGSSTDRYALNSVVLDVVDRGSGDRGGLDVSIHAAAAGRYHLNPGTKIGSNLTGTIDSDAGHTTYAASGITLHGATTYFVSVGRSTGSIRRIQVTDSEGESGTAGWTIANRVRRLDGSYWSHSGGGPLKLTINATALPNRTATGAPRVWGSTRRGEELFTEQGTIADPDGLPDGGFPAGYSFQWMRVASDKPETEVATTRNYRPVQADVGSKLKVKVSFTDGRGFVETRTSGETATITATTCSVTGVGVCNISEASDSGRTHLLNLGGPLATAFTTGGSSTDRYALNSVVLDVVDRGSGDRGGLDVSIHAAAAGRYHLNPGTKIGSNLTGTIDSDAGHTTYAASGITLHGATTYFVSVGRSTGSIRRIQVTDSEGESGTAGWTIANRVRRLDGSYWSHSGGGPLKLTINATALPNRTATGAPRVWGSTRRGEELFTEQGTIADPDGLPDGGFPAGYSFQWMRVASDKPETEVATTRNYRPVQADVGSKLKVKVSFTDGRGFVETRTSGETATITATTCSVTGVGVCNISEASDSGRTHLLNLGGPLATAFTTGGSSTDRYALNSVVLDVVDRGSGDRGGLDVSIHAAAAGRYHLNPGTKIGSNLTGTIDSDAGHTTYAASGITLHGATTYFVSVGRSTGSIRRIQVTDSEGESGTAGWTIANRVRRLDGSYWSHSGGGPLKLTINATALRRDTTGATPGNAQVTLVWNAVTGATGYEYRQRAGHDFMGASFGAWQDVPGGGGATSHVVTGLANGTLYTFDVRQKGGSQTAALSGVWAIPGMQPVPPPPPVNLAATGGDKQVTLSWGTASIPATDFQYRQKAGGAYGDWTTIPGGGIVRSYAVTGLTNGTRYTFTMRAKNGTLAGPANNEALEPDSTGEVTATPTAGPSGPAKAEIFVTVPQDREILVMVVPVVGAKRYQHQHKIKGSGACGTSGYGTWTNATHGYDHVFVTDYLRVTGLDNGTEYCVRVRAVNAAGTGAASDATTETPANVPAGPVPGQPTGLSATRSASTSSTVTLSWVAAESGGHVGAWEYRQKAGSGTYGAWGMAPVPRGGETRFAVTGLDGSTAYAFQVRGFNEYGWGTASAEGTVSAASALSVADASVHEPGAGESAELRFQVTLAPAAAATVTVDYATRDGTATAGADYTAASGTLTFVAGETTKTVAVPVLADAHDDGGETLALALSNATGAVIADGEATGTILNDGPIPRAWTARFGRTVAGQVLDAVEARMRSAPAPGAEVAVAGSRAGSDAWSEDEAARLEEEERREAQRLARWIEGSEEDRSRTVTPLELLSTSSFALTSETGAGGLMSIWGRGAVTNFDGDERGLVLDGEVAAALLGADWTWGGAAASGAGRWSAGLVLSHGWGAGGYDGTDGEAAVGSSGTVETTLTGLYPWARHALTERLEAWAAGGYGRGRLTVTPKLPGTEQDGAALSADLDLWMAAGGLRGALLDGGGAGLTLTGKTDALVVGTSSGQGAGAAGGRLAPARATVTRLRLGLEASLPVQLGGATLTPSLEAGGRHDWGDAETGFGVDFGGGLTLAGGGLQAELRGRGLLRDAAGGFHERGFSGSLSWRQQPSSDRGAALTLTQTVGGPSSGGADALLSHVALDGVVANDAAGGGDDLASRRLEFKLGYGLAAFGDRFTLTPEARAGFSDGGRDYRLGLRLTHAAAPFEVAFQAARREAATGAAPEHEVGLTLDAKF